MSERTSVPHLPTRVASGVALLLATAVAWLLAGPDGPRAAVLGTLVGVALIVAGGRVPAASSVGRTVVSLAGAAVVFGSVVSGAGTLQGAVAWAQFLPGVLGIVLVGLGVRPLSGRFARRFVSAGLAALVLGVVLVGIFQGADPVVLLAAAAAAVVAWDVAEHGISLGEQLRSDARTGPVELVHAGVSGGYGAVLVVGATFLYENGATGLPLSVLVLLLAAAVIAMLALYN